jgi:hypothetical protein
LEFLPICRDLVVAVCIKAQNNMAIDGRIDY